MKYAIGLVCLLASLLVQAKETSLMLDNGDYRIPAILSLPDGVTLPVPAVVMLHGSASQKNEVGDLYKALASRLADQGIASIRIDFAGSGDSPVDYLQYTLTSATRDAQVALNYLSAQTGVDAQRLGVIGFSQGGLIAQLLIAQNPQLKAFVAWSSVASDGVGDFSPVFEDAYQRAKAQGFAEQTYSWRSPLKISLQWFEEIRAQKAFSAMSHYNGALLAIAGSEDTVVDPDSAKRLVLASNATPGEALIIKGADHIFRVLDKNHGQSEQLLWHTTHWLSHYL